MKTYREFIVEISAADIPANDPGYGGGMSEKEIDARTDLTDAQKKKLRDKAKNRRGAQAAAQNTKQTRSSRTAPNRPYGGEYTPPDVDKKTSKRQRVKDTFNKGVEKGRNVYQSAKNKASKVGDAVRDFGKKVVNTTPKQAVQGLKDKTVKTAQGLKDAAKNAPNDVKTTLKYGRKIRPNSSTSALATRSTDLAKAANATSKFSKGLKLAGRAAAPIGFAADVASERAKGSGWLRSLAKGAVTAAGGAAGAAGGSAAGPVGTVAGGIGGAAAASKAFDVVAGKNAKERAADRLANRKRQAGGALVGTGGKTTFDTKKNTMTTGGKTVNLAKTSAVTDPKSGKKETGYLAYKDGKAVYKRADKPGTGTSNAFERIGRAINPNAYKANDAKLAAAKLKKAEASDAARNKALGVKPKK